MRSREQLIQDTAPFPDTVIKQLPPRNDDYVSWYQYAQRLLLHHDDYQWRVTALVYGGERWAVSGQLNIGDLTYGGVAGDADPEAAESQAYKRACSKAGIGLHLYGDYWLHGRLEQGDDD